jgi:hypothetical protein
LTFPPSANVPPTPTAIRNALRVQLARAHRRVRIASLRKTGLYAFSLAAPAAGKLELSWYEVSAGAHHSANSKPSALALSTTTFAGTTTKTVTLRLTSAGRRLFRHGNRIEFTLKSVFLQPHTRSLTWLDTVVLSH